MKNLLKAVACPFLSIFLYVTLIPAAFGDGTSVWLYRAKFFYRFTDAKPGLTIGPDDCILRTTRNGVVIRKVVGVGHKTGDIAVIEQFLRQKYPKLKFRRRAGLDNTIIIEAIDE